jgi:hypothetical protein
MRPPRRLLEDLEALLPHGEEPRRVTPTDGEAFLFASWFSLRGTHTWGELIDADGKELTRIESMAELDAFLNAAIEPTPAGAPGRSDEQQEAEAWQIAALARATRDPAGKGGTTLSRLPGSPTQTRLGDESHGHVRRRTP